MNIPGLNPHKCAARNRVSALRGGTETIGVRLYRADALDSLQELAATRTRGMGHLPKNDEHAMELINTLAHEPLERDQVYIHYGEGASGRFIPDRFAHLDESTGKNCARRFAEGIAFMNSHHTGGGSTPCELPFGRTFAGRFEPFEESGRPNWRALFGMYMLRKNADGEPLRPTGANGPSTSDFHTLIEGGILHDTSVGLYGGEDKCDVCGKALQDWDTSEDDEENACPHVPGTRMSMSKDDVAKQTERGVTKGKASYSIHDAAPGENSGVFDGAVPGAGFRKARSLASQMGMAELAEARRAYWSLARPSDFVPRSFNQAITSYRDLNVGTADPAATGTSTLAVIAEPLASDPDGLLNAHYRVAEGETCCATCEYFVNDSCRMFDASVNGQWVCDSFEAPDDDGDEADEYGKKKPKTEDVPKEPDDGEPDGDSDDEEAAAPGAAFSLPPESLLTPEGFLAAVAAEEWTKGVPLALHTHAVASTCEVLAKRLASRKSARAKEERGFSDGQHSAMAAAAEQMTLAAAAITLCLATPERAALSADHAAALKRARVLGSIERARYESLLAGVDPHE